MQYYDMYRYLDMKWPISGYYLLMVLHWIHVAFTWTRDSQETMYTYVSASLLSHWLKLSCSPIAVYNHIRVVAVNANAASFLKAFNWQTTGWRLLWWSHRKCNVFCRWCVDKSTSFSEVVVRSSRYSIHYNSKSNTFTNKTWSNHSLVS